MVREQREALLPGWIAQKPSSHAWPSHIDDIELVWHRLNRAHDLRPFFASEVRWAECDARLEPAGTVVASHTPANHGDRMLSEWLTEIAASGRAAKIDLKEGGPVLDGTIASTKSAKMRGRDLWFNAAVEVIGGRSGFKLLADAYPRARLSVPVDNLAPWLLVAHGGALGLLAEIRRWGITWLSISVQTQGFQDVVQSLRKEGWNVNVWDASNAVQLRDAVASRPTSITADLGVITAPLARRHGEMGGTDGEPFH